MSTCSISNGYSVRLLKYAQSLFQSKQLKIAALGRMATITRKLKEPLVYLEQVRTHLARLPSIDPNTRTLLICGYPNTGKSSFLKNISRADVDIQPYAFTTKSLFVGHFDYRMLRFQAVDTPGVLDRPLEEMNTIEMQSVTALAHLRSAVLYFIDPSEHCGWSVHDQVKLFQNLKPLFANKLTFIVVNKIDLIANPEHLDEIINDKISPIIKSGEIELLKISCTTTEGVMQARNAACERLIAIRNSEKLKAGTNSAGEATGRLGDLLKRIHVAQPMGGVVRELYIPEGAKNKMKFDRNDPGRPKLERDIEAEEGGPGVYNIDLKKNYLLEDDDWKHDKVPEIFEGKNVADFIDPDIEAKLAALEAEEEKLEAEGFYNESDSMPDDEEDTIRYRAELIREKRQLLQNEAKMRKSLKNRALIPRSAKAKKLSEMTDHLGSLGLATKSVAERARSQSRGRPLTRAASSLPDADAMDVDRTPSQRAKSRGREPSTNRRTDGVTNVAARSQAERLMKLGRRKMNRMARAGEADRHQTAALPKHLVSRIDMAPISAHANESCRLPASVALVRQEVDKLFLILFCHKGCIVGVLDESSCKKLMGMVLAMDELTNRGTIPFQYDHILQVNSNSRECIHSPLRILSTLVQLCEEVLDVCRIPILNDGLPSLAHKIELVMNVVDAQQMSPNGFFACQMMNKRSRHAKPIL
jgi:nucleolar GTP-binding protein